VKRSVSAESLNAVIHFAVAVAVIARAALSARGNPETDKAFAFCRGSGRFRFPFWLLPYIRKDTTNDHDNNKKVNGTDGFCASVPLRSTPRRMTGCQS
jgi:hypothetical protein